MEEPRKAIRNPRYAPGVTDEIRKFIDAVDNKEMSISDVPPKYRETVRNILYS